MDGTTTTGQSIDEVVSRVRGPEGEAVTLTIQRGDGAPFDVKIVRKQFDLPLVSWAMVPGRKVAMIRLDQFATGATQGIEDAIKGAKADGATAIIFDLRGNPGGYVNEAVGVASQFVGDGTVYQSVDASGVEKDVPVQPGGLATSIPLVVLTDGGTASSAEIVTGAIQDAGRGKVVGDKTFGTGTVLGRFDLSDGSSLRIGVERWLTRNGRPIWHEGLEPDVKVTLADTIAPLLPDDIRDMTPASLAKSDRHPAAEGARAAQGRGRRASPGRTEPARRPRTAPVPRDMKSTAVQEPADRLPGRVGSAAGRWRPRCLCRRPTWRLQLEVRPSGDCELPTQPQTQVTSLLAWRYVGDHVLAARSTAVPRLARREPVPRGRARSARRGGSPVGGRRVSARLPGAARSRRCSRRACRTWA